MILGVALLIAGWTAHRLDGTLRGADGGAQEGAGAGTSWLGARPFGHVRALAARVAWIRAHLAWERADVDAVEHWCLQTTQWDPTPTYFWINSARMLAYDGADQRAAWAGRDRRLSSEELGAIQRKQAARALAVLDAALQHHPENPEILIEAAHIYLHCHADLVAAAALYARALQHPRAPLYAERIHAGILWRLGRGPEALAALERHSLHLDAQADADPLLRQGVQSRLDAWREELQKRAAGER